MTENSETQSWGALSQLPGNPLMWVLIISELAVFWVFFLVFAGVRALNPVLFHAGQAALDVRMGGLNTIILVVSGWCAAKAVQARTCPVVGKLDLAVQRRRCRQWLSGSALLGMGFLIVKSIEWSHEVAAGHDLESDAFFTLFYLMTGFHAAHVVMGLIVFALIAKFDSPDNIETGAAFWHMVDLVWLFLFPILYLTR